MEESIGRTKAELHNQIMSNESEMQRLRQLLARRQIPSGGNTPEGGAFVYNPLNARCDPETMLALESRVRQLTDNLLAKQDALDSVLAQNHALKVSYGS